MALRVEGLRFSYGKRLILNGAELELREEEVLTLLGPNGCGKTTLLKCINRILKPEDGTVFIDGRNYFDLSEKEIAMSLGYVPQEHRPPFPYTVLEFVLLGRSPHLGMFSHPSERDRRIAMESLKTVGIEKLAKRAYTELSGGERQLVLIARALATNAKILLLDEPTSHLDFRNSHRILSLIRRIVREKRLSAIITLHDPNLACMYSDRIAIVNGGRIIRIGKPDEVMDEQILREVYGINVRILRVDGFNYIFAEVLE